VARGQNLAPSVIGKAKKKMRIILAILGIGLSIAAGAQQADPILLAPAMEDGIMLRAENMLHLEADPELGWSEITGLSAERWRRPRKDTVGQMAKGKVHWIRIPVENTGSQAGKFRLEIRWMHLESVEMRLHDGSGFATRFVAGEKEPRNAVTEGTKSIVFPWDLAAGEAGTVYLLIDDPMYLYLPIYAWAEPAYQEHSRIRLAVFSLGLGVLLVMTLYHAVVYMFTRDTMYLFYSNVVFSALLFLLAITGVGRLLIWGDHGWFAQNAYPVFSTYCFLATACFLRVFLELSLRGGWVQHLNNVILAGWVCIVLGNIIGFQEVAMGFAGILGTVGPIVWLVTALYLWYRGSREAKFFSIAWTPICLSTAYVVLALLGVVPNYPIVEYSQTFSFVAEAVLLSVALADRINRERKARDEAQALALQQQKTMMQMKEEANAKLEQQVVSRTRELQRALSELACANDELAQLSNTDSLTGLANRRHFDKVAEKEVSRARRSGLPLTMMIIDIDHFKAVNDTHGHLAGDHCLAKVASAIRSVVSRQTDLIARFGGEELAVILPDTTADAAKLVAERIRREIADARIDYQGESLSVTASIGVAGSPLPADCTVEDLLGSADKALYSAKQQGRNRVVHGPLVQSRLVAS
jgi:diguanylate cyclase (GGDEF)-like protein